jgi:hypothetical protein
MPKDLLQLKMTLTLALGLYGAILIGMALRRRKPLRAIQDLPTSKTETAAQGLVEFQGFAWSKDDAPKNFRGAELIYYTVHLQRLEKVRRGNKTHHEWVTRYHWRYYEPFFLVDATGMVLIEKVTVQGQLTNNHIRQWRSIREKEQAYLIENFIDEPIAGFPPSNFLFGLFSSRFRLLETIIEVGSPIHVQGNFRSQPDSCFKIKRRGLTKFSEKFFDRSRRALRKVTPLLDANKDGTVTTQEARDVYTRYAGFCRSQSPEDLSGEIELQVHGSVGATEDHPLQISDAHEEQLINDLIKGSQWRMIAGILLLGAAFFVFKFKWENYLPPLKNQTKIQGLIHPKP